MIVLITNDDGFSSSGIRLLREVALGFASEVWIVAPCNDRSGSARSIKYLIENSLEINKHDDKEFSVLGTPVECVIVALHKLMKKKPDLILSGINYGSNIGDEVCYSGTIGAAMEGAARLISSIALSQAYNGQISWVPSQTYALKVINALLKQGWPNDVVMNVNFPSTKTITGVQFIEQGKFDINPDFALDTSNSDYNLGWYKNNTDNSATLINKGFITITPMKSDFTDYNTLNDFKKLKTFIS
ncbi:5'/3'-nucleotidase SurE [Wolbachia endosymbiont of Pentidionis agamae]|uniref:5'/3'-nucleotidase SurE n=1 Tax=Wolbachia endosymbiont of Pentidionis agamae TaxID=3110435 RepID=UPI002FD08A13